MPITVLLTDDKEAVRNSIRMLLEIKSLLKKLEAQVIAISFWNDEGTQALAESLGAVTLLDKMKLATELIPAIKDATGKQRGASV